MCGRFYIDDYLISDVRKVLPDLIIDSPSEISRMAGDICPSAAAPVIVSSDSHLLLCAMRWGYTGRGKSLMINARAETAAEKPSFRKDLACRRCAVPASSFYEWNSGKDCFSFSQEKSEPLFLAGLYSFFENERRFVLLTTDANLSMKPVHPRMPLLISPDELPGWILKSSEAAYYLRKKPEELQRRAVGQMNLFA
jgi:putative SOS response-associated peptidase YedK